MNEDQLIDAAEREMDLYRKEIARLQVAHVAEIANLTDQRNRVSETADQLREQLAKVLGWFTEETAVSSRRYASATRAQLARAYKDGALTVPEELRRFL